MAEKKYIDKNGVIYLIGKLKQYILSKIGNVPNIVKVENGKVAIYKDTTKISEANLPVAPDGTTDYNALTSKPRINNVELTGNKTLANLGINIPTKVSQLTNDSSFVTQSNVNSSISSALANITSISYQKVSSLPSSGRNGVIYLLPIQGANGNNVHEEYIYIDNKFEKLGQKEIDLSGYVRNTELTAITNQEIDSMFTGD